MHKQSRRNFLKLSSSLALGTTLLPFRSLSHNQFINPLNPLSFIERSAYTMGSIVTVKAFCDDEWLCNRAIDEAFREMKTVDKLMSVFDKHSQLSLVNGYSAEKEVEVDRRIIDVLTTAKHIHDFTNGSFDVTVEPLMKLYGFHDDVTLNRFPSDREISSTLDGVGSKNIIIDEKQSTIAFRHPNTKIDLGGIAVGYAIDCAAGILRSYDITSALINHSGDIYAIGAPPESEAWEIEITDPKNTDRPITTVFIKDQALSTSGNYENFRLMDGRTIGHLLNPATGKTAGSILSGTTIAPSAIEADALSTGFFVMGLERTDTIVKQSSDIRFIGVIENNTGEEIVMLGNDKIYH